MCIVVTLVQFKYLTQAISMILLTLRKVDQSEEVTDAADHLQRKKFAELNAQNPKGDPWVNKLFLFKKVL